MSQNLRLNLKLRGRWFHAYMIVQFITNLRVAVAFGLRLSESVKIPALFQPTGHGNEFEWRNGTLFDIARNLMQLTLKETLLPEGQFYAHYPRLGFGRRSSTNKENAEEFGKGSNNKRKNDFARYSDWDPFLKIVVHLFGCYDYEWGRIKNLGLIKIKKSKIGVVEAVYLESVYKLRDKGVITPSLYGKRALILERFDMVMSRMRSKKGFFLRKHYQPEELLRLTHTYPIASPACAFDLRGVLQCYLARLWPQRTGGVCVLQAAENSEHGQSQKKKPFGINGGWLWA
ncbi:hypothetical protein EV360DRAFT_67210 [Lentinula raphanica]|nr:hypothetical protein EV360DRAFT_67210 [Lentinula raphanica]